MSRSQILTPQRIEILRLINRVRGKYINYGYFTDRTGKSRQLIYTIIIGLEKAGFIQSSKRGTKKAYKILDIPLRKYLINT